jgi:hypothetical protein
VEGLRAAEELQRSTNATGTVLSLDADEELTDELQIEIGKMLETDAQRSPQVDGYKLRLRHVFLGRWMRYGGYYPDLKLRLFRRLTGSGPAHFTDRPVHESVAVAGRVETMKNDFLHHGYPNLEIYLEQYESVQHVGSEDHRRQRKNQSVMAGLRWNVALVPKLTFVWNYVFRPGFLDGREGLLLHLLSLCLYQLEVCEGGRLNG